ncbi:hypothetical protein [Streptomyces noursei]
MMRASWRDWETYLTLHRALAASRDHQAHAHVLDQVRQDLRLDREAATKAALLTAATGDLGTALTILDHHLNHDDRLENTPRPELLTDRATHTITAWSHMARTSGGFVSLLFDQLTGDEHDYQTVVTLLASARGTSIRTARTAALLLQGAAGWDYDTATGLAGVPTTAHQGLNRIAPPRQEDRQALFAALVEDTHESELPAHPQDVAATLDALHRLHEAAYYVGHTTDTQQASLIKAPRNTLTTAAWTARAKRLPHRYLGELSGWYGPNPARKRAYADTGRIVTRTRT